MAISSPLDNAASFCGKIPCYMTTFGQCADPTSCPLRPSIQQQAPLPPHDLGFYIWRNRRGWPTYAQRIREAWWILTGKWSLHRAWQKGKDRGHVNEVMRSMRVGR